jgi:transcriptional regulator with XRE-family HTH domain
LGDIRIATALRAAREHRGLSREELAYRAGVSWAAIAQIESGRRADVRLTTLSALAGALRVSVDYLAGSAPSGPIRLLEHHALVYEHDDELAAMVAPPLAESLSRSEAVLVVTTKGRIELIRRQLGADASRAQFVASPEWYRAPATTLRNYRSYLEERAAHGAPWIQIVGEPVWGRRSPAEVRAWTRYESIINLVFAGAPATIRCPYNAQLTAPAVVAGSRTTHPKITDASGFTDSADYQEPEDALFN